MRARSFIVRGAKPRNSPATTQSTYGSGRLKVVALPGGLGTLEQITAAVDIRLPSIGKDSRHRLTNAEALTVQPLSPEGPQLFVRLPGLGLPVPPVSFEFATAPRRARRNRAAPHCLSRSSIFTPTPLWTLASGCSRCDPDLELVSGSPCLRLPHHTDGRAGAATQLLHFQFTLQNRYQRHPPWACLLTKTDRYPSAWGSCFSFRNHCDGWGTGVAFAGRNGTRGSGRTRSA